MLSATLQTQFENVFTDEVLLEESDGAEFEHADKRKMQRSEEEFDVESIRL